MRDGVRLQRNRNFSLTMAARGLDIPAPSAKTISIVGDQHLHVVFTLADGKAIAHETSPDFLLGSNGSAGALCQLAGLQYLGFALRAILDQTAAEGVVSSSIAGTVGERSYGQNYAAS